MSNIWTLLITDDCQEDREVYREYLSGDPNRSYQFIEAGSAQAGLELCQRQHCDAILLDFRLPDMTGLEFLDELKQQSNTSLPVIMLTGQGDERVAVQAMKQGVRDYLVKQDLEPDVLQLTVRNAIQQAHRQARFGRPHKQRYLTPEVAFRLHRSPDEDRILQTAVTEAQKQLECDRVAVYQVLPIGDDEPGRKAVVPTLTKRCETSCSDRDPVEKFLSFLTKNYPSSFQEEQTVAIPGTDEASILVASQKTYLLSPIPMEPSGSDSSCDRVWGLLVACQNSNKRQWQTDEAVFFKSFTCHLAIALQQSHRLTQALAALETHKQLNALTSQLVATVSHEYRNPLAVILAAASTLKLHRNKLHESKQRQFLQTIEEKARQMTQLVDHLLVLETFEAGQANFDPMPFELLQFISSLIEEQRQTVGDRHELIFKIAGNTKGFWGDEQLLRLILVNLLSNAVKYSTDGGAIEVHLTGNETHITIKVTDEGIGIPAREQSHVLQSFDRGSNIGKIPGTGLGLAIVKACVDLHGGDVALVSKEGKGTQFTVCLPKRSSPDLRF
ncbi:response regulator [Oscillatoriales cyanobacterium LEGE 11467]|uniref:histidine kinase n=1 Tax=Zarconia navalis LEGE 11467 TaxID=1828826 RepID=A0A928Z5H3_9CYAN|nr:ATP-binding protein [Zarconia navalis]MBE9039307.1 response regulator [Zarconia navalis LEGE 11467]